MKIDIEVALTLPFLANRTKQRKLRLREMKTSRQKTIEGIFRRVHSAYAWYCFRHIAIAKLNSARGANFKLPLSIADSGKVHLILSSIYEIR